MVGVTSVGLGKNALLNGAGLPHGKIDSNNTYFDNFALSEIIIFIAAVSIVLIALSCLCCLVFHCCPTWFPKKIRSGSKNKKNYKKHCATLTIPVVIVSDDTGIVDPPLYQPSNTQSDAEDSNKDFEELTISISNPTSITHSEKLM